VWADVSANGDFTITIGRDYRLSASLSWRMY
jgi:hypothetical protein